HGLPLTGYSTAWSTQATQGLPHGLPLTGYSTAWSTQATHGLP
ncbi:LOW QUALITY PROTEIN: uncharacterized protein LOC124260077, partial [Haliotis rubra]